MGNVDSKILKKYDTVIWNNLNIINSSRVNNISIMVSLITLLLFVIDYLNFKGGLWHTNYGYVLLFYSHIVFFTVLVLFAMVYYILNKYYYDNSALHMFYVLAFSFFILNFASFTSGWIDQMINGGITIYVVGCFVIAILVYLKPKHLIILHIQAYLFLVLYLNKVQKNSAILQSNNINSLLIVVLVCFISITISKLVQKEYLNTYNLEELVKTRADTLIIQQQAINRLQQFNLIGELSAGIAHEIRNPLTTVRGFLQLLGDKDYYKNDKEYFDLMIDELDRANSIITDFLGITKDKKVDFVMKDLNHIILKLVPLIDTNSLYRIRTDLGDIPELYLDDKEICQVILNLAINGCESMSSGGCLTIKTYRLYDKVILEVQDQGDGIKPEILEKLGTPFFTTKDKGTGLGLAVCSTIIEQHNAKLDIVSDGNGSNFRVIFNIAFYRRKITIQ